MPSEFVTMLASDPKQLDALWGAQQDVRGDIATRRNYYHGHHAITGRGETYADGTTKAEVVTNFVKYVVNRYVGAISEVQVSVEAPKEIEQAAEEAQGGTAPNTDTSMGALALYDRLITQENIRAKDRECLRNCLLFGYGIELHSYDAAMGPRITVYDPDEWAIVRDTEDHMVLAIRRVKLQENTVYGEAVLRDATEVMTVYTDTTIYTYRKAEQQNDSDGTDWELIREDAHQYKRIPVVQWRVNETRASLISDAILRQNDEYNDIDSAHGDSVRYDVDSLLKIHGIDGAWVQANETTIRDKRVLPLPEDAEADYLTRTFDTERVNERLGRTRANIHMMAEVPDVLKIVGTTGSASGIALKLMFTPMEQAVASFAPYIEQCIRERIELLNRVWRVGKNAQLTEYNVGVQFLMPVNRIEEWSNIGALDGAVSHKTQLRLLTDISNPDAELEQIEREAMNLGEPADVREAVEAQDAEIAAKSVDMESIIQEAVTNLSTATTDYMVQSGALERAVQRAKPAQSTGE